MSKTAMTDNVVTPAVAKEVVKATIQAGILSTPPMLHGPPGVGKSSIVRAAAQEMGVGFIDLRLVQLDVVDLRGLPYFRDDPNNPGHQLMGFAAPEFLPHGGAGVLFLDELPQATPLVMNGVSELVLDRRIGAYHLPDDWVIVAAGNMRQDRAATNPMPGHLKNRFTHMIVEPNFAEWIEWAEANGLHEGVISFLKMAPDTLNKYDPDANASPTSRTWEFTSRILKSTKDPAARRAQVIGCLGKAVGTTLLEFLKDAEDIPTYEQVVKDPGGCEVPPSGQTQAILATTLAGQAKIEDGEALITYLNRVEPDSAVVFLISILGGDDREAWMAEPKLVEFAKKLGVMSDD